MLETITFDAMLEEFYSVIYSIILQVLLTHLI